MPKRTFTVGKIDRDDIDLDSLDCALDTTGSWDGNFPDPGPGDYLVTLGAYDREEETVLVSRRYTEAVDPDDAASLALSAFAERHDYETNDEGEILPVTVEGENGIPLWIVNVDKVV